MIVKLALVLLVAVGCTRAAEVFRNAQFQCGIPKNANTLLIVNGVDAKITDWPWHAAIRHHDDDNNGKPEYVCGGTLISERFVITAAHCADNVEDSGLKISVQLGVNAVGAPDGKIFNVLKIHRHAGFSYEKLQDDVALLELESPVPFSDAILPVCLSRKTTIEPGKVGAVVGWGFTEKDEISTSLKLARLPVVEELECKRKEPQLYGKVLTKNVFCAGYTNGTSACNGDSGGGIVFERGDAWYLGGIVSFTRANEAGSRCLSTTYSVFTKLAAYMDWIEGVTRTDFSNEYAIEKFVTCSVPGQPNGQCVPVQQCRNLFDELRSPLLTKESANSFRQKVCELRGVRRSVCCDPDQVERIPIHRNALLLPSSCGVAKRRDATATATRAGVFEFPWVALVRSSSTKATTDSYCTGSLINNRYVLSSALCLKVGESKNFDSVRLGEHTLHQDRDCGSYSDPRTRSTVEECAAAPVDVKAVLPFILHPQVNKPYRSNDVGLVRLEKQIQFTENIQPVCLPIRENLRSNFPDDFVLSLFEITNNGAGRYQTELYKTRLEFTELEECEERFEEIGFIPYFNDKMFCALAKGPNYVCTSFLGAPLVAMVPPEQGGDASSVRAVQYGISLHGPDDCTLAQTIPKPFIRVPLYVDWILESISK